jgi:hypothetical protein
MKNAAAAAARIRAGLMLPPVVGGGAKPVGLHVSPSKA